ncbi:hypothetical protein C5167_026387 [Papaver somniferum]|nr:hypothetical protein C5167_026387 [Papaver somniferum]
MTDQFAALAALSKTLAKPLMMFLLISMVFDQVRLLKMSDIPGNVENVRKLLQHPGFDLCNPNKTQMLKHRTVLPLALSVYSLIGGFCGSLVNFHAEDGLGYKFLGEIVVQLDKINPQVAFRMVSSFSRWRCYDETRRALPKAQLEMIMSTNGLSENVFEIASKSLAALLNARGYEDVIPLLLSKGISVNVPDDFGAPLHHASSAGEHDTVKVLLDHVLILIWSSMIHLLHFGYLSVPILAMRGAITKDCYFSKMTFHVYLGSISFEWVFRECVQAVMVLSSIMRIQAGADPNGGPDGVKALLLASEVGAT